MEENEMQMREAPASNNDASKSSTATSSGNAILRKRPSLLLMYMIVRATEPTLELGLKSIRAQVESSLNWLKSMGAISVDHGEPHFDDLTALSGVDKMQASMAMRNVKSQPASEVRKVICGITAVWDIEKVSSEDTLVLLDKLRFETSTEQPEVEQENATPEYDWQNPQDMIKQLTANMENAFDYKKKDDSTFVFITRISDEEKDALSKEAFDKGRMNCERLARAASRKLGTLASIYENPLGINYKNSNMLLDQQTVGNVINESTYEMSENELYSDNPRSIQYDMSVSVGYNLL